MQQFNMVTVKATRKKQNPYLATSDDGLNKAFGKTKEEALENLEKGIKERKQNGN